MNSIYRRLFPIVKIAIAFVAYGFVAYRLQKHGLKSIASSFKSISELGNWLALLAAFFLMPLNWFIEAAKWRLALKDIEHTSYSNAFRSVWYGIVAGLLTPNRLGEPLGRLAFVSSKNRAKAAILAVWCGMGQQSATVLFGLIGFFIWIKYGKSFSFSVADNHFLFIFCFVGVLFLAALFGLKWVTQIIQNQGFFKRFLADESVAMAPSFSKTSLIVLLSFLRYAVFSTQLILVYYSFGISTPLLLLYAAVFLTYLFTSFVPAFVIAEAGIRAGFALIFVGVISTNSPAIVSATLLLWTLNVALPALIAAWFPWFKNS